MLNPRIYRAGWIPVLLAIVLAAFSLRELPAPSRSTLSPQAFDGGAAAALARGFARNPTAGPVVRRLRRSGFAVRRAGTGPDRTILASLTGFSSRRVVLVADRASPSATGILFELGHVLGGRTLGRTLVLASVAGPDPGTAVRHVVGHLGGPVDAAIVVGDVGTGPHRRPWVVPFASGEGMAPLSLRRTVEAAVRTETLSAPGTPGLLDQLGRFAVPLTLSGQGPLLDAGIPAVLVSPAGERGGAAGGRYDAAELDAFGRGILRAATALDSSAPISPPARALIVSGQQVPEWAVRLLTGALLVPLLLGLVDGLARVRRRRGRAARWLGWALAGVAPFALAALALRALGALGVLRSAPTALALPLGATGAVTLGLLLAFLVAGWLTFRPLAARALGLSDPSSAPGAALAVLGVGFAGTAVLWVVNPYAAGASAVALHLWLLAAAPETRPRRSLGVALMLLGALPLLLIAVIYGVSFGLGPLRLAYTATLAVAGGVVPLGVALAWSLVAGAFGGALALVLPAEPVVEPRAATPSVLGPAGYAGPGSLGGTESALRR